jgi:hypothetical protein
MQIVLRLQLLFAGLLVSLLGLAQGQTPQKTLLLGKWTFEKFEFTGWLVDVPAERQQQANAMNKGITLTFVGERTVISEQKGGPEVNNGSGTYKLLPGDRIVIVHDTSKIIQLDEHCLKLYRNENSPVAVFRKP